MKDMTTKDFREYLNASVCTPIDKNFLNLFDRNIKWVDKKTGEKYNFLSIEIKEKKLIVVYAKISENTISHNIDLKDFLEMGKIDLSNN